jgi:hypothetical protein
VICRLIRNISTTLYARGMHYDPNRVGKEPTWRPSAWFTRQDRLALREAPHVWGDPARLACDAHRIRGVAVWRIAADV